MTVLGILISLGFSFASSGQSLLMDDKPAMDSMAKAVNLVYNYQFDKASHCLIKYKNKYANHPAFGLFNSILHFWKYFPIGSKPKEYSAYIRNLNLVIRQAEKMTEKYPISPEPDFFIMMANLILARHHSEEGEYIKAVNETRKAYPSIKKGFDWKSVYPDYYFSTGLYNYYRVAFPENHPLYNSFTVFFPDGNKASGLKDLEIAALKSTFSKAESYIFLCTIHMRDQFNIPASLKYSTSLYESYPGNWLFSIVHAECLLESQKGDAAGPIISRLLGRNESSALLAGYYLKGLLERINGNTDGAKWAFQKALLNGAGKDRLTKGYIGLIYNELAKIAQEEGRIDFAKKYARLALANCSFKKVKDNMKKVPH
jgi:hypothetical protein